MCLKSALWRWGRWEGDSGGRGQWVKVMGGNRKDIARVTCNAIQHTRRRKRQHVRMQECVRVCVCVLARRLAISSGGLFGTRTINFCRFSASMRTLHEPVRNNYYYYYDNIPFTLIDTTGQWNI